MFQTISSIFNTPGVGFMLVLDYLLIRKRHLIAIGTRVTSVHLQPAAGFPQTQLGCNAINMFPFGLCFQHNHKQTQLGHRARSVLKEQKNQTTLIYLTLDHKSRPKAIMSFS